jgi:hypothetical protein
MSRLAQGTLGSARASRADFGVAPKRTSHLYSPAPRYQSQRKVRDREDALANTRDARAPQI